MECGLGRAEGRNGNYCTAFRKRKLSKKVTRYGNVSVWRAASRNGGTCPGVGEGGGDQAPLTYFSALKCLDLSGDEMRDVAGGDAIARHAAFSIRVRCGPLSDALWAMRVK